MSGLPILVVTGASGFVGRRLLDTLKHSHRLICLARRSQTLCGAPFHDNIIWKQVDIGVRRRVAQVWEEIREIGPVEAVIHLAAHYDFTGEDHPEYQRTNVEGTRHVLEECRRHPPKVFIFSSSVAACSFPKPGEALDETSPTDGDHIYAKTKSAGEAMLAEYADAFKSVIVRYAALFSDWCEYPPLYMFLRTWLSSAWNARVLGGKGESAIPYLHLKDAVRFMRTLLRRHPDLDQGEVLICGSDGATSHGELYCAAVNYWADDACSPWHTPRPLIKPGIRIMDVVGRLMGERPFERPWMADYVDLKLTIDSSRTRKRLGWEPRERLHILRRLPFLLENRRGDRVEWTRVNRDAMKQYQDRPCLAIYYVLNRHREEIARICTGELQDRFPSYAEVDEKEHEWNHALFLRTLFNAVRTRERVDFMDYCRDLALRRLDQGFSVAELVGALETVNDICVSTVEKDPESEALLPFVHNFLTMPLNYGIDVIREACEEWREQHYPEELSLEDCEHLEN
jgi:nucleoside-diphosphate-sugar epimerase